MEHLIKEYPGTSLDIYGDWYELYLKIEHGSGYFRISGYKEEVQNSVNIIINRFNYVKRNKTMYKGNV